MNTKKNFGKTPLNPILMSSINESILFLNSLTTNNHKPIFYHRVHTTSIGKSALIDCYEIFKNDGKKEILFIVTYANEISEEIPEGYLVNTQIINPTLYKGFNICKTIGVNYKLRKFPDDLI
jgi:hypothetical protein